MCDLRKSPDSTRPRAANVMYVVSLCTDMSAFPDLVVQSASLLFPLCATMGVAALLTGPRLPLTSGFPILAWERPAFRTMRLRVMVAETLDRLRNHDVPNGLSLGAHISRQPREGAVGGRPQW